MANLAATPLVNAKLYRHFAAVTFAITLCVALFANGEARQVAGDAVNQENQAARLRAADAKKFGPKQIGDIRMKRGGHSSFGEDYDPSYGAASDSEGSRPNTSGFGTTREPSFAPMGAGPTKTSDVLSPGELAKLSPQEQSAYLEQLRSRGAAPRQQEEVHDLASIEARSRARSGRAASD